MPLIIEGSDQTGKTTLCEALVKRAATHPHSHGFAPFYSHMTKPPETWNYDVDYVLRAQPFAVQDRFHLGGIVYGDVRRGGTKITPEGLRWLEARLALMGTFVVVLCTTDEVMAERLKLNAGREEMYDAATILKVNAAFAALCSGDHPTLTPRIDLVFTAEKVDEYPGEKEIDRILEAWCYRLRCVRDFNSHPHLQGFRT